MTPAPFPAAGAVQCAAVPAGCAPTTVMQPAAAAANMEPLRFRYAQSGFGFTRLLTSTCEDEAKRELEVELMKDACDMFMFDEWIYGELWRAPRMDVYDHIDGINAFLEYVCTVRSIARSPTEDEEREEEEQERYT